jgi:hypothetical protein
MWYEEHVIKITYRKMIQMSSVGPPALVSKLNDIVVMAFTESFLFFEIESPYDMENSALPCFVIKKCYTQKISKQKFII